jgi:hypothetical protein
MVGRLLHVELQRDGAHAADAVNGVGDEQLLRVGIDVAAEGDDAAAHRDTDAVAGAR